MHRRHNVRRERRFNKFSSMLGHAKLLTEQRLSRRCSETDEYVGFHDRELRVQPGQTSVNLDRIRLGVDAPFATGLPLEMLDDVRYVYSAAIDSGLLQRSVEQFSG